MTKITHNAKIIKDMNVIKNCFFVFSFAFIICFASCSLNYDIAGKGAEENLIPEMIINKAEFTRIKNRKEILSFTADTLELYKTDDLICGENIYFSIFNNSMKVITEGSAKYFSANQYTEICYLMNNVQLNSYDEDFYLTAERLKWNGKTEQLVAAKDDIVNIQKGKKKDSEGSFSVDGKGFAASLFRKEFSFDGNVSGFVEAK